jgi:hypothetical protein
MENVLSGLRKVWDYTFFRITLLFEVLEIEFGYPTDTEKSEKFGRFLVATWKSKQFGGVRDVRIKTIRPLATWRSKQMGLVRACALAYARGG